MAEQIIVNKKNGTGFTSFDDALLSFNPDINLESRIKQRVDSTAVKGEVLSHLTDNKKAYIAGKLGLPEIISRDTEYLLEGESNRGLLGLSTMSDRHNQTLLVAALLNDNFNDYGTLKDNNNANIDTINFILNTSLYGYDPKEKEQNFLTKLVRNEIGGKDSIEANTDGKLIEHAKNFMIEGAGRFVNGTNSNVVNNFMAINI